MYTALLIFIIVTVFILTRMFIVVETREAVIIERLGKYHRSLKPGFHFLLPFLEKAAYSHEIREQVLDIPSQSCVTRDNVQVQVDGLIYLKVTDPYKASYGVNNYRRAAVDLAQTTMRSEVGKLSLDDTFSERERLNENIIKEIDHASDPWGIKVLRYEIKNITPSTQQIDTMEKQMEAERQKRADIIRTEGEKKARINESMGERQAAISRSEGEKQRRINEAEGRAEEIRILSEASAAGIEAVAGAISKPGGRTAVKIQLLEQFIKELEGIYSNARISVLPPDLAGLRALTSILKKGTDSVEMKSAAEGNK